MSGISIKTNFFKGFVTADMFVEILRDLDEFLSTHNIMRPVILIIDSASPHTSLAMPKFCQEVLI